MTSLIHHRPNLAVTVADAATGVGRISGLPPGLFLAAPRRTGKSTFLELDLVPELDKRGYLTLYVDLWKNQERPPTELISSLIAQTLAKHQGLIKRAADSVGLSKVSIHGVEFSLDQVGHKPGAALSDALDELRGVVRKPIALIVDEAQHVVKVDELGVMFALKAARDALNRENLNLVLVMSGSDRDKLVRLVSSNSAPFLGAEIHDLPHLDHNYANFVAGLIAVARPDLAIDNARLHRVFKQFECRPEEFANAMSALTNPLARRDIDFHAELDTRAAAFVARRDGEFSDGYLAASPLQRALLGWMLRESPGARMFSKDALAFYSSMVGEDVNQGAAQYALNKLREAEPPLVWRSMRGDYALEEVGMQEWYLRRVSAGTWPPA